jgi:hypothetical protein
MSQNMISMDLDATQWAAVDGALTTLERELSGMAALTPDQRMRLIKMGDKSEAFCRQALDVMGENPGVLPGNLDMAEVRRDLATHDALRPRLVRLTRLLEKANDTDMALGSDVMSAALEGYAFLKIAGKGEGLHGLRKVLSQRFDNSGHKAETVPPPVAQPA